MIRMDCQKMIGSEYRMSIFYHPVQVSQFELTSSQKLCRTGRPDKSPEARARRGVIFWFAAGRPTNENHHASGSVLTDKSCPAGLGFIPFRLSLSSSGGSAKRNKKNILRELCALNERSEWAVTPNIIRNRISECMSSDVEDQ